MKAARTGRRVDVAGIRGKLDQAEELIADLERSTGNCPAEKLATVANAYQELCARYGYLETFLPGTPETARALRLVARGREVLYAGRLEPAHHSRTPILRRPQEAFALIWPYVVLSFLIVAVGGMFALGLLLINPELGWSFLNEDTAEALARGEIWTDKIQGLNSVSSSGIATNNIKVTLSAFALGITAGVGTVAILFFNGWHLAGLFALTHRYDMSSRLLEFILAHGFLELSIIFIAGGCGLYIGDALIHPGSLSRIESLRRRARPAIDLILFGAACLLPCGFVEGYVSPSPSIPVGAKLAVGLTLGAIYWMYLLSGLRRFRSSRAA